MDVSLPTLLPAGVQLGQPSTLTIHEPHNVSLLREGPPCSHSWSQQGRAGTSRGGLSQLACLVMKFTCFLPDLRFMHTKYRVLHRFQDQVLPRLKKKKKKAPQNQHVMIAKSVNFYRWENCIRQEVEAPVHQLQ